MADELFEVRDGELSDDEPFYINPKDERSSYPFTDGELMEDVKRFFRAYIFTKPSREVRGTRGLVLVLRRISGRGRNDRRSEDCKRRHACKVAQRGRRMPAVWAHGNGKGRFSDAVLQQPV